MLSSKIEIKNWLDNIGIKNYHINDDLTVDVNGNVNLNDKNLNKIPIQFGIVKGCFFSVNNTLDSLKGLPKEIHGFLALKNTNITIVDINNLPMYVSSFILIENKQNQPIKSEKGSILECLSHKTILVNLYKELREDQEENSSLNKIKNSFHQNMELIQKLDPQLPIKEIKLWFDEIEKDSIFYSDNFYYKNIMLEAFNITSPNKTQSLNNIVKVFHNFSLGHNSPHYDALEDDNKAAFKKISNESLGLVRKMIEKLINDSVEEKRHSLETKSVLSNMEELRKNSVKVTSTKNNTV